jgi:hypothetical protein
MIAEPRRCAWCRELLPTTVRADSIFCSKLCRQAAFRLRQLGAASVVAERSIRVAYADPPYPGRARRYYEGEASYGGEVDHRALVAQLERDFPDGWALSTAADALRDVLPLCPPEARVCPWCKPKGPHPKTYGLHGCWEPLIVVRGRRRRPGKRDWLVAHAARGGGSLPGRKPLAFCAFLFSCLGLEAGDELVDLFPGSGIIGRAWAEVSRAVAGRAVAEVLHDASPGAVAEVPCDASRTTSADGSDDGSRGVAGAGVGDG